MMKLLIAYDGSPSADKAIDDLQKAGLPEQDVEVLAVTVAEVWMPPHSPNGNGFVEEEYPEVVKEWTEKHLKVAKTAVHEAETLSRHAKERILHKFPNWNVTAEALNGSPGWEILSRAESFEPDLIVVGSQGRNAVGRILLGSISQKVLTEAKCSVRIARGKTEVEPFPLRIMIGFDGSIGSKLAVEAVAERRWGEQAEICLLSAVQSFMPAAIGRFVPPVKDWSEDDFKSQKNWMEKVSEPAIHHLENAGLKAGLKVVAGNPKDVLIEQAKAWQADSIFLGAHSYSGTLEKFLIGSTSAAVAERADCSVEAVRRKTNFS